MSFVICLVVNIAIVLCLSLKFGDAQRAYSRSHYNSFVADLAIDGDPTTCYKSGFGFKEWLLFDMGGRKNITGVRILGNIHTSNVRIGDFFEDIGSRDGFTINALCYFTDNFDGSYSTLADRSLSCSFPMPGRYISVQLVDPVMVNQLIVCDIKPILA